ncbi:oxygen-independent coproporphyrinogen III oxidase [Skeletonema marinoi]|uniref:Radical S-adenosyl methionine domain-containing protein 1, mitochondrial n=2 Tax=Skeletonema marinoi TaxID=267567 RepID=A0AAD9DBN5_9STRA|nr:oxygen-independent coproporphyrinogen III oxidase [Skeletonema marinoi]
MTVTSFYWIRLPLQTLQKKRGSSISWHQLHSNGDVNIRIKPTALHQQSNSNHNEPSCDKSFGLYVHIPYCRRRCNYCDFAIVPIGDSGDDENNIRTMGFHKMDEEYKNAILNEINSIGESSHGKKIPLRSIYFGGGTPSLAPLSTLRDIMHALLHSESAPFQLLNNIDDDDNEAAEITIEMDPGTFDERFLQSIKGFGFNRISLGVQSFDDNLLSTMGRVHRSADIYNSVNMITEVFGEDKANYSLDLISGVPGLTLAGWTDALHKAVSLRPKPKHISVYDLQVESGTTFGKWYADAVEEKEDDEGATKLARIPPATSLLHPSLPSADDCAFMYRYASGYLRARSYEHYEISSYALQDGIGRPHRSKHNQIYWEIGGKWYAIGLGATSNVNGTRYSRPRALSEYNGWTKDLGKDDSSNDPPWMSNDSEQGSNQTADKDDALLDIILTRLRTKDGLDLDWIANNEKYGDSYVEAIKRGVKYFEDTELVTVSPGRIKLTDPDGFLFSNNIISNIFAQLDDDTD